ncbi:MAG: hypothetical protein AAFY20_13800, partial [Cyanobacteria bacterium J06639_14]
LEAQLGLVSSVTLCSSYSRGIHLYFPFNEALPSWKIGKVISSVLTSRGFSVEGGQLEVFPNNRLFSNDGESVLFKGHRLPLQAGSYLLNDDFMPINGEQDTFVKLWRMAQSRNALDLQLLEQVEQVFRKPYLLSHSGAKFLNDLNAEIDRGWTSEQQSNYLFGRIAMRTYIFSEVLYDMQLTGKALAEKIAEIAQNAPGFFEFSNHISDLMKRAWDWARSVEASRYYPYRSKVLKQEKSCASNWNERQSKAAHQRIKDAVVRLQQTDMWPGGATARVELLVLETGASKATLYKPQNKKIWYPEVAIEEVPGEERAVGATPPEEHSNLLGTGGCNGLPDEDFEGERPGLKTVLGVIERLRRARTEQRFMRQQGPQRNSQTTPFASSAFQERIDEFLRSGDSILIREAERLTERLKRGGDSIV